MASVNALRRTGRLGAALTVIACVVYYALPLLAMARFSFQFIPMAALDASNLFERWSFRGLSAAFADPDFRASLGLSLGLALGSIAINLALLLPTALWAHLRTPHLRPLVEGITLLPWVVPPIALVVGVAATFRGRATWFLASDYSLVPFYVVSAMPFTYRALDAGLRAIDLKTLTEAARNLGAGWWTALIRVVLPNIRASVIGSSFLTATVVLGEFTIAVLLLKQTFPTYLAEYQRAEPQGGMALALVSMFATTVLLMFINAIFRRRSGARLEATRIA
ncbi:MAG: ABC transporter permease subunit [Acidimicrobiia bacterium]|nr:ABC transporter permease subunit [Acidimicrobiia bacterium]MDH4309501.1 ABC transporter permease subunit [Acidimicrobiia bacterium]